MTKQEKRRKYCGSCRDDFYNDLGAKECWHLESAKPVQKKFVHRDQRPPWKNKCEWTLDCCDRAGYIKVNPDVTS